MSYIGVGVTNSALVSTGTANDFSVSPSMAGSLTAATGVTATTGDITATSGNVVVTAGNLELSGTIITNSNPVFYTDSDSNVYIGPSTGNTTNGSNNICVGHETGLSNTGSNNTLIGQGNFFNSGVGPSGSFNIALGSAIGAHSNSSGSNNIGIGSYSTGNGIFDIITSGSNNVCIGINATTGNGAGYSLTSGSQNIYICSGGGATEIGVIRIGNSSDHTKCLVQGIYGATVDVGTGTAVFVDSTGLLGTVVSTRRLKDNIKDMGTTNVMKLRPVTFNFKSDQSKSKQHGLIAEEVQDVFPDLVTYDAENKPYSVKYHDLPAILLNELQRLAKRVEVLEKNIH